MYFDRSPGRSDQGLLSSDPMHELHVYLGRSVCARLCEIYYAKPHCEWVRRTCSRFCTSENASIRRNVTYVLPARLLTRTLVNVAWVRGAEAVARHLADPTARLRDRSLSSRGLAIKRPHDCLVEAGLADWGFDRICNPAVVA